MPYLKCHATPLWCTVTCERLSLERVKILLNWLHSYQLLIAVSAQDHCQHLQENYLYVLNMK